MRIVFLGSSEFAVASLDALVNSGLAPVCVVTQPDKSRGRGMQVQPTPVKNKALCCHIPVYQPENINQPESVQRLRDCGADFFVVIAYGQLLSQDVIDIPRVITVNLHASLLPKYRGAAPVNWAIIRGEKKTGVTVMKVTRQMDAGPIICQQELSVGQTDTAVTLEEKLARTGAQLLVDSIRAFERGTVSFTEQDASKVTFAPKLKKSDGLVDWSKDAGQILGLIRGCAGWPGAFTYYKGKLLKIHEAVIVSYESGSHAAGSIVGMDKNGVVVVAGSKAICLTLLQVEGSRVMTAFEFLAGHKVKIGERMQARK